MENRTFLERRPGVVICMLLVAVTATMYFGRDATNFPTRRIGDEGHPQTLLVEWTGETYAGKIKLPSGALAPGNPFVAWDPRYNILTVDYKTTTGESVHLEYDLAIEAHATSQKWVEWKDVGELQFIEEGKLLPNVIPLRKPPTTPRAATPTKVAALYFYRSFALNR